MSSHPSNDQQPALIRSLLRSAAFRHATPDGIHLRETHGAWVLLAGEFAYKIKKPVHLPFMDFSTLEKRRADCFREVEINRRLAVEKDSGQDMYLGVLPIVGTPEAPRWGAVDTCPSDATEYAVKMRRFDGEQQLDAVCQRGALSATHLTQLARDLVRIQSTAGSTPPDDRWGRPESIMRWAMDNFTSLEQDLPTAQVAAHQSLNHLRRWTEEQIAQIDDLLLDRLASGRVREGHGDLHLGNLVLMGDRVLPFDAIEFNDELRWIDVASEVAFLWMDLMARDQVGLAHVWLSAWVDASGDVQAPTLLPFFAVYRAMVRAKVAAIEYRQHRANAASVAAANQALAHAMQYLELAEQLASTVRQALVITHGLSGSGKSTEALAWMQSAGENTPRCIRLRSDVERKRLHGLGPLAPSGSGLQSGLYAPSAHQATYNSLLIRSRALLLSGWAVVVDAAFLKQAERASFHALADEMSVPFGVLAPQAPVEELRRRIEQRASAGGDASEATVAVLDQQLGWMEGLDADERQDVMTPQDWPGT
ncbi:AAA family ATPase [Hydrogenophaga sp. 5NK40-0174]|uniref:bifunctional aminoglycoside phosphotransferase/ATP-binding protein n=1 Tax=Hydrogenophaga sp. 5NK40-0174 TaxID=3127649 RepID=UPI00310B753B